MREKNEFVDDIHSPDFLSAILIRSPVAHGILRDIEIPALPNKVHVIRASDIPGINRIEGPGGEFPVLAEKELCYIGEPVAILTGHDKSILMDIALECRVKADGKTPVFDPKLSDKNAALRLFTLGNTGEIFEKPETVKIIEGTYTTGFQEAWSTDPNGALAIPLTGKSSEKITGMMIHTASQWPFHITNSVAKVLGLNPDMIHFRPARLELHMDGKFLYPSLCSCHAAIASWITGKPVKLILERTEDFRFSPKRVKTEITLKSALDKDGRILATEAAVCANMGTAALFSEEILDRIALGALGIYRHDTLSLNARAALTNIPPAGPLAGFGFAQGLFAMERHASRIADELREDPAEWRKNVFLHKGSRLAIGTEIREQVNLEGLLDMASSMSDYRRKWASFELLRQQRRTSGEGFTGEKLRGIGIAGGFQGNGLLYPYGKKQGVEITLNKDASVEIKTSMVSSGEEQIYPWKTIAAKELGVEENMVRIVTEGKHIPDSGPSCLSRNITLITRLVERSCQAIKKQRFRDPLPITVCRYYNPVKGNAWGSSTLYDENTLSALSYCAAVVETEIDMAEYIPRVRGIWLAVDGGAILAESRARKSLTVLSIQAINWALREEVGYKDGIIPIEQIHNYPLPVNEEVPPIKIDFQWSDGASKGIGELPFATIPAAYVQSVSQAMDHPFAKIPVSSADIWNLVEKTKTEREEL